MKTLLILTMTLLPGCAYLVDLLPCDELDYTRTEKEVDFKAKCRVPS